MGILQLSLLVLMAAFSASVTAKVPIEVSHKFSAIVLDKTVSYPSKDLLIGAMRPNRNGDSYYLVQVQTSSPGATITTYPTSDVSRGDFSKPTNYGEVKDKTWERRFDFSGLEKDGIAIVVRPPAGSKKPMTANLTILRIGTWTDEERAAIERALRPPIDTLEAALNLPKFKVVVRPCGDVNAFSDPDVTVCTELLDDLRQKGAIDAAPMVLMHEVGHTLLNLWGLPGWDNEDLVDEFAASLLASKQPEALKAMAKWLRAQDSISVAAAQLARDDRHGIPIQRARNIERVLADAVAAGKGISPAQARWIGLLAAHIDRDKLAAYTNRQRPKSASLPKRQDIVTVKPLTEYEATGVCVSLTIASMDATKQCGNTVSRTVFPSGRTSILVATLNNVPLTLSTAPEESAGDGTATYPVETVGVPHGVGEGYDYHPAHGKCSIARTGKLSTLKCDLTSDRDGKTSALLFRFQDWAVRNQPSNTTALPTPSKPDESVPKVEARPTTTTMMDARGTCEMLIMGGIDLTPICGNSVRKTKFPTGINGFVVATKNQNPLIISTRAGESRGGVQTFPVETVNGAPTDNGGIPYFEASGTCTETRDRGTTVLQCDLTTVKDGVKNALRFRFKDWTTQ